MYMCNEEDLISVNIVLIVYFFLKKYDKLFAV